MADRVLIKTLTDYHLEDYLRSPNDFYSKHFSHKKTAEWQDMVQGIIYRIVKEFFLTPISSRNATQIFQLINRYREQTINLFDSREQYYNVLGSVSQHLIHFLLQEKDERSPLFVMEKLHLLIPQWNASIAMTLPLANWGSESFVIKKFVIDDNAELIKSWIYLAIFFCDQAFQKLPEKLTICHLLTGETTSCIPTSSMITEAVDYINLFKYTLEDGSIYELNRSNAKYS